VAKVTVARQTAARERFRTALPPDPARSSSCFDRSTIFRLLGTYGTIVVLIVMLAAFSIFEPGTFATVGNFRNILNDMAIGTIVAGGLTVPLVAGISI
jgi:ABC-type xylose transport system permease subunit